MNKQSGTVAILLATRNGAAYLNKQLTSIEKQIYQNWTIWFSDDGSTDDTINIIQSFLQKKDCENHLSNGPQRGPCENFMSLVANTSINADYYAFADQDDIWLNDKLDRAVDWLKTIDDTLPALYCSRTRLIDENEHSLGYSPLYTRKPSFGNALLQNIASGNTMVFNQRARVLLQKVQRQKMIIHDWSLYQIVSGCGGVIRYDPEPTVLYRQHGNNVIGNSMRPLQRVRNFLYACSGRAAVWNDINHEVLVKIFHELTSESRCTLATFRAIRDKGVLKRIHLMRKSGIYHQQFLGSITTLAYILLNKF